MESKSASNGFKMLYDSIVLHMRQRKVQLLRKLWTSAIPEKVTAHNFHCMVSPKRNARRLSYSTMDKSMLRIKKSIESNTFIWPKEFLISQLEETANIGPPRVVSLDERFILTSPDTSPHEYAKFLKAVAFAYDRMRNACAPLEKLCGRLLQSCSPVPQAEEFSLHRSLFMSKILNCNIIKVLPSLS